MIRSFKNARETFDSEMFLIGLARDPNDNNYYLILIICTYLSRSRINVIAIRRSNKTPNIFLGHQNVNVLNRE